MTEEWRIVIGFPNYRVSNLGRVQTNKDRWHKGKTGAWKPLKRVVDISTGYLVVNLSRPGYGRTFKVHTLVLEAFVGPRPPKMVACHNNGIKTDARLENLRWDTYKANELDKLEHGTYYNRPKMLSDNQVLEILNLIHSGAMRQFEIAKEFGITQQKVSDIKHGRVYKRITRNDSYAAANNVKLAR